METMQRNIHLFEAAARLEDLCAWLDELHDAAMEQRLQLHNGTGKAQILQLLQEIRFIADETAAEIESAPQESGLRLVKGTRQGTGNSPLPPALDLPERAEPAFVVVTTDVSLQGMIEKRAGG